MAETRGKYNSALPTLNDNQFSDLQLDSSGRLNTVVTAFTPGSAASSLGKAEDNPHSSGDVGVQMLGVRNDSNAVQTSASGDYGSLAISDSGQVVIKEYSASAADWSYAAAASGIVNTTTAVTVKAAAGAGIRNYITGMVINTEALGAATEFAIRDGAAGTVLFRIKLGTAALPPTQIQFLTPLKGTANTLVEVVTLTASVTGGVFVNLSGYVGP